MRGERPVLLVHDPDHGLFLVVFTADADERVGLVFDLELVNQLRRMGDAQEHLSDEVRRVALEEAHVFAAGALGAEDVELDCVHLTQVRQFVDPE